MTNSVPVRLEDLGQQSFIPRPFGGRSQVVLNTTSFSAILSQLNNVDQSLAAQENSEEPGPLSILSTGCYLNATSENAADGAGMRAGDGYRDCPAACADPSTMFNSSYTLWNCLTLGAASAYVADYDLAVDSVDLTYVGTRMGFDSLDQFNATQIFSDALQCIKGSCSDYSLGSCSKNVTNLSLDGVQNEVLALFNGLQSYCGGMESVVDSDLAGPGVGHPPDSPSYKPSLAPRNIVLTLFNRLSYHTSSKPPLQWRCISSSTCSRAGCSQSCRFSIRYKTDCHLRGQPGPPTPRPWGCNNEGRPGSAQGSTRSISNAHDLRRH